MRAVLRHRDARLYLGGQLLSLFGDSTLWLAVGIWVKKLTGSSSAAGLTFFAFAAGSLVAPLAGWLADRVRRRPLLIATNLTTAAVVLLVLLVSRRNVWLVYVVMLGYGVSNAVIAPAQSALVRQLVPDALLPDANAVLSTGREALRLLAPLVGAALVAVAGTAKPVALLDAASFVVVAVSLLTLRVREPVSQPPQESWQAQILGGVRHIRGDVVLRQVVTATAVVFLVVGFSETLIFSIVQHSLHRSPTFVGVLGSVQGAGSIVGGVFAAPVLRRVGEGVALGGGLAVFGLAEALWLVPTVPSVLAGAGIAGAGLPVAIVGYLTLIQRRTPLALQGRTTSAADTLLALPQTVSIAAGAALLLVVDYRLLLLVMVAVISAAGCWLLTRPEQRVGAVAPAVAPPGPGAAPGAPLPPGAPGQP